MARTKRKTAASTNTSSSKKSTPKKAAPRRSTSRQPSKPKKSTPKPSPKRSTPKPSPRRTAPKPSPQRSAPKQSPQRIIAPKPSPRQVSTVNASVPTQNTGRVNPKSPTTNNPQVQTQNDIVRRPKIEVKPLVITSPIKLPSGQIWSDRPPTLPNENQNKSETPTIPTYGGYTLNIGILPSIKKEFALHESGEKLIDPQRLTAIQEGRIILTEGIKTTFTPSEQQLRVLQAMEKQKQAEKDQARKNNEWQKQQDRLQAAKDKIAAEKQKTQDFRNRTDEEILQNFIKVQTEKELAGQFDNPEVPTNLNQYLAERGFDVTRPETIPTSALKKTTLDTAEKMLEAGVAPRIVNIRLESMGKPLMTIDNPNDTITNKMTDTTIQPSQNVNWTGIREKKSSALDLALLERDADILYTAPLATFTYKPVGRSTPLPKTVTTTGYNTRQKSIVTEAIDTVSPIPKNRNDLALIGLALLIGM